MMRYLFTLLTFWVLFPVATTYSKDPARITALELKEITEKGKPITLIDVRTPREYNNGHIPGSISLPMGSIQRLKESPYHGKVVLYCTNGVRSMKAKGLLEEKGIKVLDLEGGIVAWSKVGGKVVTTERQALQPKGDETPIMSGYPKSFQVPKGVCEQGLGPSLVISR